MFIYTTSKTDKTEQKIKKPPKNAVKTISFNFF